MYYNKIYNEDCIKGMEKIPDESIDLTITSPPYNLGIKYEGYDDNLSKEEFSEFIQLLCNQLYRITKVGRRVCINVPFITKDGITNARISADQLVQNCLDKAGFIFREKIIWNKKGVSKRTAWGSYQLPSCPWIVYPTELILVYYKKTDRIQVEREKATLSKKDFKDCTYNIWWVELEGEKSKDHPASFPDEIPRRLINFYSYKGDLILDPFLGVGTTCIVAKMLEREYVGFEQSSIYYDIALEKLK